MRTLRKFPGHLGAYLEVVALNPIVCCLIRRISVVFLVSRIPLSKTGYASEGIPVSPVETMWLGNPYQVVVRRQGGSISAIWSFANASISICNQETGKIRESSTFVHRGGIIGVRYKYYGGCAAPSRSAAEIRSSPGSRLSAQYGNRPESLIQLSNVCQGQLQRYRCMVS